MAGRMQEICPKCNGIGTLCVECSVPVESCTCELDDKVRSISCNECLGTGFVIKGSKNECKKSKAR